MNMRMPPAVRFIQTLKQELFNIKYQTIMARDYQKINTLFMRDERSIIIPSMYTTPEFEYLKDLKWECTEKIDGTNIHADIYLDAEKNDMCIEIHGRTERANIPKHLLVKLQSIFTKENVTRAMNLDEKPQTESIVVSIYGEGYGVKIQKGGNYLKDDVGFILFDVRVGTWWLSRKDCEEFAGKLGVPIVPLIGMMTIPEAIEYVKAGFKSTIAENKDYDAEGLVLKTPYGLQFRNGQRIITKIKTVDFRKYQTAYGDGEVKQTINPHYNKK